MVENCVLDWGAIATIAAAILTVIVAYCISKQWKTQKRVETVSNIAKEVYLDIRVCPHLALHQINIQAIRIIDL